MWSVTSKPSNLCVRNQGPYSKILTHKATSSRAVMSNHGYYNYSMYGLTHVFSLHGIVRYGCNAAVHFLLCRNKFRYKKELLHLIQQYLLAKNRGKMKCVGAILLIALLSTAVAAPLSK